MSTPAEEVERAARWAAFDNHVHLLGKSVLANRRLRGKGVIRDDEVLAFNDLLRDWRAFYKDGDKSPKTAKEIADRFKTLELRFRERGLHLVTEPDGHEALALKLGIVGAGPARRRKRAPAPAASSSTPASDDDLPVIRIERPWVSPAEKTFLDRVLVAAAKAPTKEAAGKILSEDNWFAVRTLQLRQKNGLWQWSPPEGVLSPVEFNNLQTYVDFYTPTKGSPGGTPSVKLPDEPEPTPKKIVAPAPAPAPAPPTPARPDAPEKMLPALVKKTEAKASPAPFVKAAQAPTPAPRQQPKAESPKPAPAPFVKSTASPVFSPAPAPKKAAPPVYGPPAPFVKAAPPQPNLTPRPSPAPARGAGAAFVKASPGGPPAPAPAERTQPITPFVRAAAPVAPPPLEREGSPKGNVAVTPFVKSSPAPIPPPVPKVQAPPAPVFEKARTAEVPRSGRPTGLEKGAAAAAAAAATATALIPGKGGGTAKPSPEPATSTAPDAMPGQFPFGAPGRGGNNPMPLFPEGGGTGKIPLPNPFGRGGGGGGKPWFNIPWWAWLAAGGAVAYSVVKD